MRSVLLQLILAGGMSLGAIASSQVAAAAPAAPRGAFAATESTVAQVGYYTPRRCCRYRHYRRHAPVYGYYAPPAYYPPTMVYYPPPVVYYPPPVVYAPVVAPYRAYPAYHRGYYGW
jgi:hypothetical protein